jgi:hypothetical protein
MRIVLLNCAENKSIKHQSMKRDLELLKKPIKKKEEYRKRSILFSHVVISC